MKSLAIIPARFGSKRILNKNIKSFCGYPIIKYSIDAALESDCFNEVMVSTDDRNIADIAIKLGARVPFLRSLKNSNDYAGLADVVEEVLLNYKKAGKEFDFFCCLLATAPFVKSFMLGDSFKQCKKNNNIDAVIPVVKFDYPIQRSFKIENGLLKMNWPDNYNKRSQDLEYAYHDSGQFYWVKTEQFLKEKTFFLQKSFPYELLNLEVHDIDVPEDWIIAEFKYKFLNDFKTKERVEDGTVFNRPRKILV